MPGRLIVIEGPDGAGTTVHSRLLADALRREGRDVLLTAEPSGGPIGTFLRSALAAGDLPADALQLLFCADRADHLALEVAPALGEGAIVVMDRYVSSTIAYGVALGLDVGWLRELNKKFIQHDVLVFLLPPLSIALNRIRERGAGDALEQEDLQQRVHEAYRTLAQEDPSAIVMDTSEDIEVVAERILSTIKNFL